MAQATGVRPLPSLRPLRGAVTVRVASVAPPPRPFDASSLSEGRAGSTYRRASPDVTPPAAEGVADVTAQQHEATGSDAAATLERKASGRNATTSSGSSASSRDRPQRSSVSAGGKRKQGGDTPSPAAAGRNGGGSHSSSGSGGGARFNPRMFTKELSSTKTVADLQVLFEVGRSHGLNSIHIATVWTRLAKLMTAESGPARKGPGARRGADAADASAAASASAAVSTSAAADVDPRMLALFLDALESETTKERLQGMQARGLANFIWAAAKLKPAPAGPTDQAAGAPAVAEAAATAAEDAASAETEGEGERARPRRIRGGYANAARKEAEAAAAAAAAQAAERLSTTVVHRSTLDAWAEALDARRADLNMHDLSNVFWAMGRLGYRPSQASLNRLAIALYRELGAMVRVGTAAQQARLAPRDAGAAGSPAEPGSDAVTGAAAGPGAAAAAEGGQLDPRAPQQLSNVLLGLVLLDWRPDIRDFWETVWVALDKVVLSDANTDVQSVVNVAWALGKLSAAREELEQQGVSRHDLPVVPEKIGSRIAYLAAVRHSDRMLPSHVQDVFLALPRLGFMHPSPQQASKLGSLARRVLPACDCQAVSSMLVSLLRLGAMKRQLRLKHALLNAFGRQLEAGEVSPEACARVVFFLSVTATRQPDWLPALWTKMEQDALAGRFAAPDIAFAALGLKRMFAEDVEGAGLEEAAEGAGVQAVADASAADSPAEVAADAQEQAEAQAAEEEKEWPTFPPPPELLAALRQAWDAAGEGRLAVKAVRPVVATRMLKARRPRYDPARSNEEGLREEVDDFLAQA
ncbi:hypothetical protein HYH02_001019 [Chlamydomonas schloesseri]|uniref:Uncharacterized protein n=1 Tax=Chlamydomonas schloesseri TaxID=2026947 RepID=A0A835WTK8_9CHLO|nr:hypothetical protein HYH02_001019 [Chlamydomonas schloesseri]|eukprot:KAG2453973.1 hypothetical protein HYH02_001019 [Chlamydomonas schloesseri]